MAAAVIFFGFLLIANGVLAQETAPVNETAPESGICRKCICKESKVDCSGQGLTTLFSDEEWAELKDFKPVHVDLSDNSFENITVFPELPIEILNLSRCGIESIEKASFKHLQSIRVLDLSHNKLTAALHPDTFQGRFSPTELEPLEDMRTLNLAYNEFHSLHPDLFDHLSELTELDLSGNPFVELNEPTLIAMSSLPLLKVLRLRSCGLTEIRDKFLHIPLYLERLDVSDNLLKAVPQELEETKNLLYLNLNQNPIEQLDMASEENLGFPRLSKLKELHMCNMPRLKRIGPGALAGLEQLESLHMSYNPELSYIHPKALARPDSIGETYDWPLVEELYLQSNNLQEIDSRLISRWDLLKAIDVSDNPLLCDCSTQWMVSSLVEYVEKLKKNSSAQMICQDPVEMRGFTMQHLHDTHRTMRCVDKYGNRPEKDGGILLGTLIGVLLTLPLMLALVLLWRRGVFAFIGLPGPRHTSRPFYKRAPDNDSFM